MDQNLPSEQLNHGSKIKALVLAVVIIVIAVAAAAFAIYYRQYLKSREMTTPEDVATPPVGALIENPDLGSSLYKGVNNPLQNKLPEAVSPVPNPLGDIYKNPFE